MNIGIDARPLISKRPSGIGVYLLQVMQELIRTGENTFYLYTNRPFEDSSLFADIPWVKIRVVPGKVGTLWLCYGLKKALKTDKIEVFWGTQHMLPLNTKGIRRVVTVHDLALLINPGWGSRNNALMQNIFTRKSCRVADRIAAPSNATREDVLRLLGIPPQRVTTVHLGAGTVSRVPITHEGTARLGRVEQKPYFLYVGTLEPRKNITGIVRAFEMLNDRWGGKYALVLAGGIGWRFAPIQKVIDACKYDIFMPGYVSAEEKCYLMQNAAAFVFPSNYEGFGLPVLEAMQYGLPVVTARISSLPEVGGDLAYYAETPDSISEIADCMEQAAGLDDCARDRLAAREAEWVKNFPWETCARETLRLVTEWAEESMEENLK